MQTLCNEGFVLYTKSCSGASMQQKRRKLNRVCMIARNESRTLNSVAGQKAGAEELATKENTQSKSIAMAI